MFLYSTVSTLKPATRVQPTFLGENRRAKLTDGWDGGDDLTKLEFVENSGLSSGIQTDLRKSSKSWTQVG